MPMAGKITHAFFDKTGTLTTDSLIAKGVVNNPKLDPAHNDGIPVGGGGAGAAAATPPLTGSLKACQEVAAVIGGCHSLLQVDGRLLGDPIELAALRAIGWGYNAQSGVAQAEDRVGEKEKMLKEARRTSHHARLPHPPTPHTTDRAPCLILRMLRAASSLGKP